MARFRTRSFSCRRMRIDQTCRSLSGGLAGPSHPSRESAALRQADKQFGTFDKSADRFFILESSSRPFPPRKTSSWLARLRLGGQSPDRPGNS